MVHKFALPVLALGLSLPAPVVAQEDDRGYLQALLEDNLSGAGRKVTITGFAGALSSRATIQKLTIADDQGIWITLDNVVLDWSRTALLSGSVIVNELSASSIALERLPAGEEAEVTPEAGGFTFALPELPVSIDIGKVSAPQISLGPTVLGQALTGTLAANVHLSGGQGTAGLSIERTDDGPDGLIALNAAYANETGILSLDLDAREGADGIVATALGLPGTPAAALTLQGQGTIQNFAANFALESDGTPRLAGPITVKTNETGATEFITALKGNPAPLFLPEYAEFLGDALELTVSGAAETDGAVTIGALSLHSQSLNLSGRARISADGLPDLLDLTGTIASADGAAVLLPISGDIQTRITRGDLRLAFDAAKGNGWTTRIAVQGLDRTDLSASSAILSGVGTIDRHAGARAFDGAFDFDLSGLGRLDADLLSSLGTAIKGHLAFDWREGGNGFNLPEIRLSGSGYDLSGNALIEGLDTAMKITGAARLDTPDLSRFSPLAGRPLGGAGVVNLSGWGSPLSGAFDLTLDVDGRGLKTGIAEADRMLAGQSKITASVLRDETGMTLRSFEGSAASLNLTASGKLATAGSDLKGRLDWGNLSDLGGTYAGALSADVSATGTTENGRLTLNGTADGLRIGQAQVDRLIAGRSDLVIDLGLVNGEPRLNDLRLNGSQISADIAQTGDAGDLQVSGRLNNLALIAPQFPGPVTLSGRIRPVGTGAELDLRVQGPAAIDAQLSGRVDASNPDLRISGTSDAAVANGFTDPVTLAGAIRYDLRMAGGWSPANASGRVTVSNGRVAVPARGMSLERMAVTADLAGGRAQLNVAADTSQGGSLRLTGPIGLTAPYSAGLSLSVMSAKLRDPELYDTTINGTASIDGPLLGAARLVGRFALRETELRVPSTGFASGADLEAIQHIGASAAVRDTLTKAGVGASSGASAGAGGGLPNWSVDLEVSAPNRVFIRGRGLDAELGGTIRVGGTLNALIPSGGMELIRGRLDILGKRLTLNEASLQLEGDFVPYLTVSASNSSADVTSYVNITGRADDPEVSFTSDPEMAEEEVLAYLLFGRGLDTISAFQAAQLAGAVATLAGRGGVGILGKLRQGLGVDDLDVQTGADGNTSVSAGKYISRDVYTEIGVDQTGNTRLNLNYDVKPGVTVKGRMDGDGQSGVGIYLEKDY